MCLKQIWMSAGYSLTLYWSGASDKIFKKILNLKIKGIEASFQYLDVLSPKQQIYHNLSSKQVWKTFEYLLYGRHSSMQSLLSKQPLQKLPCQNKEDKVWPS